MVSRCLAPVEEVPLAPLPRGSSPECSNLVNPDTRIAAAAWLPLMHTAGSAATTMHTAAEDSTAQSDETPLQVVYLLAAFNARVHVFALQLPGLACEGLGADPGVRRRQKQRQPWRALLLGCIRQFELPSDHPAFHRLLCTSAPCRQGEGSAGEEEGKLSVGVVVLVGASPHAEGDDDGGRGGLHPDPVPEQRYWQQWRLEASTTEGEPLIGLTILDHASIPAAGTIGGGGISCCRLAGSGTGRCTAGESVQLELIAGTEHGVMQRWGLGSPTGPLVLLHEYPCGGYGAESADPISRGEVTLGHPGKVVDVAQHGPSGCVAAALAARPGEEEDAGDAVCIWRRRVVQPQAGASSEAVHGGAVTELEAVMELDAELPLDGPAACLAWVTGGGITPVLAVALCSGGGRGGCEGLVRLGFQMCVQV